MALPAFDLFAPGAPATLALFGSRVSGLVLVAPVFSARPVPMKVKSSLVILLSILMVPVAQSHLQQVPDLTPAAIVGETLVGFGLGLGAALLMGAAESAGELLSIQIGLSGSAILDPLTQQQTTALGQLVHLFAICLVLSLDGHLVMLDALGTSVQRLPVGTPLDHAAGMRSFVSMGSTVFALGLQFAAPVVAVVMIANVALAVLSRAAPQLQILQLAFPIQILVGLGTLVVTLPFIATWFLGWEASYDAILTRAMTALSGVGGR
ncbi:MAG: flagellar biosynthetic protein FliR [Gemmatimonadetes bacterium]|nr:flagellar biosynthetic protein FliR [Gemmatimonadota bacterium]MCC6773807.1 flagellar biosynthetic protein FliR [Gemmatimonadaceae bacterium]